MPDNKLTKITVIIAAFIMSPISLNAQEVNDNQNNEQPVKVLAAPIYVPPQKSEIKRDSPEYIAAYSLMDLRQGGAKLSPTLIRNLRNQVHGLLKNDASLALLEEEYPGLINAGLDEMMPIVVRQTESGMPDLFARQAELIAKNMSLSEIKKIRKVFESPTFRRIRTAAQTDTDITVVENIVDEDRDFNQADIDRIQRDTVKNILPKLSKEDNLFLIKTGLNPTFRKFQKLLPRLNAIEARWSNEETPEETAEIEEAAARGYEKHIAKFEGEE